MTALRSRWDGLVFTGISPETLGLLRALFCASLVFFHATQFYGFYEVDPGGAAFRLIDPMWHLQLFGVDRLSPPVMHLALAGLFLVTITAALGLYTRTSLVLLIVAIFYLKGLRDGISGDLHHRYVMVVHVLFLLLLSKSGQALSLDARRRRARGAPFPALEPWEASWPVKSVQLYVCSFYLWSLIAKLRVAGWAWFADGTRIQELLLKRSVMWGATEEGEAVKNLLAFEIAQQPTLCFLLGLGTFAMEAGFPLVLLLGPRGRLIFLLGVTLFHVANLALAYVGFVLIPIVFLFFFDLAPAWERLRARLRGRPVAEAHPQTG